MNVNVSSSIIYIHMEVCVYIYIYKKYILKNQNARCFMKNDLDHPSVSLQPKK